MADEIPGMPPRKRVFADISGESLTKQSMAMDSDINTIVNRHIAHDMPVFPRPDAMYGDFVNMGSFHECLERVRQAQEDFDRLPAAVRDACRNDVGVFLEKIGDAKSRQDLVDLGLLEAAIPEKIQLVKVVKDELDKAENAEDEPSEA